MTKLVTRQDVEGISTPVGADPRTLTVADFESAGHTGGPLLDIIRKNCLQCVENQADVRRCALVACVFWPYRMGNNPWRTRELSDEQRAAAGERLAAARAKRAPAGETTNNNPTVFKIGNILVTIKQKEALEIIDHRRRKLDEIHGKTMNKLIAYGWVKADDDKPVLTDAGIVAARELGVLKEAV